MTYTQKTKTQWRRRMFPLSTKLYDEFKLVKTEYDATQASASTNTTNIAKNVQADSGTSDHRIYDGGPLTCSSNTLSVNFGYSFSAAPMVKVQALDTSSIICPQSVTTASFVASSSAASTVFNWEAYGA